MNYDVTQSNPLMPEGAGMEPRLTRAEYWLLESVVEFRLGLHALVRQDLDQLLNKPPHGLPPSRLADVLADLFIRGWIESGESFEDNPGGPLDREAVGRALAFTGDLTAPGGRWYGLTAAGGAVWEAFAAPDWDRYLCLSNDPADGIGEYIGANDRWVRRYLSLVHITGLQVVPGSERWDEVRPWQATYWKELPVGHRVRFALTESEPAVGWDRVPAEFTLLSSWWCRWR